MRKAEVMGFFDGLTYLPRKNKIIILAVLAAVILVTAVVCIVFANSRYTATSMRLLRVEGSVKVFDTNGKDKFVMNAVMKFNEKSGFSIPLFEASVLNDVYLNGLDKQEIINMNAQAKNLEKFAGLKVGDVEIPNNNAGNWE